MVLQTHSRGPVRPDRIRSGAGNARARVWDKKNLKKFKKTIDRTLNPCYNIDIIKENRKEKSNAEHRRIWTYPHR